MPLGRNLYPPTRDTRIAGHARDIRRLERRLYRPGPWQYATPLDPAPAPSDLSDSAEGNPFQNGWQNIALPDGSWSPLRWRFSHDGRVELVGAIDGGALNTICVTLPSAYRPTQDVYATISSTDGGRVLTVKIDSSTGDVTVIGVPQASATVGDGQVGTSQLADGSVTDAKLSDSGVTADTYGDASHVAEVTVNAKGRVTSAVSTAIQIAEAAVTGLVADLAAKVANSLFTAKGDILAASAAETPATVPVGSDGDVLTADSGAAAGVSWQPAGAASSPLTTKGDLWGFDTADDRVPVGSDGDVLTADSGAALGVSWQPAGAASSPLTTKGDLWGFDTVDDRIPVGSDGDVLTADSLSALGVSWQAAPGGSGDTLNTVASSGASQTVDFGIADVWDITLDADCTLSLSGFTNGDPDFLTILLRQDATGGRTVTWPTITWIGTGLEPTLHSDPGDVDSVVLFSFDGGTTVFGIAQTSASGLAAGTSFPGSPSDGDLFYRTDRNILYFYKSSVTSWLSVDRKYVVLGPGDLTDNSSTAGTIRRIPLFEDIYIESWKATTFISGTNSGSAFWTYSLRAATGNYGTLNTLGSFSTNGDSGSTITKHSVSVDAVVSASSWGLIDVTNAKTGAPGTSRCMSIIVVRSVG
jgi:hypothetical protein